MTAAVWDEAENLREILRIRQEAIDARRAVLAEKRAHAADLRGDAGPDSGRATAARERVVSVSVTFHAWGELVERARLAGYVGEDSARARGVGRYVAAVCAPSVTLSDARGFDADDNADALGLPDTSSGLADMLGVRSWVPDVEDDLRTGAGRWPDARDRYGETVGRGRAKGSFVTRRLSLHESTRARLLAIAAAFKIGARLGETGRIAAVLSAVGVGTLAVDGVRTVKRREKRGGEIDLFGDGGGLRRY